MAEYRVAIIGAGMISHRHMTIYSKMPECRVVAVSELDAVKLKAWAERYGFEEKDCYSDFREMLKRDDIDWVDVCVHNNLHAPIAIEVMKAGFACYSEKPMAGSYADCMKMIETSKKLNKKFAGEGRVLIRPSGTEPMVRVMIEGKDQKMIDEEAKKLADLIQQTML